MKTVISLYDYTGEAVRPWAEAGYKCYCFDIQHRYWQYGVESEKVGKLGGEINYIKADLHDQEHLDEIAQDFGAEVAFISCYPVCQDMAISGAAHFARKKAQNEHFQDEAVHYAVMCADFAEKFNCPYYIENPVSVLATMWRKPDYYFHPFEYGGYIPKDEAIHPKWPDYIAPRDGYSKKTCLWTNNLFFMPAKDAVECDSFGSSTQHRKLGGKSMKTKNIRSATPRGFARAVFEANHPEDVDIDPIDEYGWDDLNDVLF